MWLCDVQCRKYKASEKVRRRADVIYHKFKKLFTVKDGDDFTKVGHVINALITQLNNVDISASLTTNF